MDKTRMLPDKQVSPQIPVILETQGELDVQRSCEGERIRKSVYKVFPVCVTSTVRHEGIATSRRRIEGTMGSSRPPRRETSPKKYTSEENKEQKKVQVQSTAPTPIPVFSAQGATSEGEREIKAKRKVKSEATNFLTQCS